MKQILISVLVTALLFVAADYVAAKEAFSCEKIKDKAVRASCIESRDEKNNVAQINPEIEKFVINAKAALIRDFKDPESARLTGMYVISRGKTEKVLCGFVNAKNSYGGYTGAKSFYVKWSQVYDDEKLGLDVWVSDGSDISNIKLELAKAYCGDERGAVISNVK